MKKYRVDCSCGVDFIEEDPDGLFYFVDDVDKILKGYESLLSRYEQRLDELVDSFLRKGAK